LVTDREKGELVCAQYGLVISESAVDTGPEWGFSRKIGGLERLRSS
jgi:transcription initiation factor TFIIIB Brf1 subunit/transcription initiation factor TFIIB